MASTKTYFQDLALFNHTSPFGMTYEAITPYALAWLLSCVSALPLWHHATPVTPSELTRLLHQSCQGAIFRKKSFCGGHFSNIVLKWARIWKNQGGEAVEQPFQESREQAERLRRWAYPGSQAVRPGMKARRRQWHARVRRRHRIAI
jgi:hypothetical protein